MPNAFRLVALLSAIFFVLVFLSLMRRRAFQPFYTALWGIISLAAIGTVVFESQVKHLATRLGLEDASFLVMVGAFYFIFIYLLHLSASLSATMDRMQELISKLALLDMRLREKSETEDRSPASPGTGT